MTSIYRSYAENNVLTAEEIANKRAEASRSGTDYWKAVGGAVLALAGATVAIEHFTSPKPKTVVEIVQPYDTPYSLVQRAEKQYGKDPGSFNVQQEAIEISNQNPVIHLGDRISVEVK